jgi:hypothetical protein
MNCEQMKQLGINEVFLPIDGFQNYEVSNYGNVRNRINNRILKPIVNKKNGYCVVNLYGNDHNMKIKRLHILVLNAFENNKQQKEYVDHIDNIRTNNCLFNLRFATKSENQYNQKLSSKYTCGYKGVTYNTMREQWCAYIYLNDKRNHIGYFDNIEDAKQARQIKAKELFGEYINKCEL